MLLKLIEEFRRRADACAAEAGEAADDYATGMSHGFATAYRVCANALEATLAAEVAPKGAGGPGDQAMEHTKKTSQSRSMSHYAAIVTSGGRAVVWGAGDTPDDARRDAEHWLAGWGNTEPIEIFAISAEKRAAIEAGDVSWPT